MQPNKKNIAEWFRTLQAEIASGVETLDGEAKFKEDAWERPGGGGGFSRILENGAVFEKGGVNFSEVHGEISTLLKKALQTTASEFYATGISIVIHPQNPMVPIIHMNTRYFETSDGTYWFGGGIDLTPHYIDIQDATLFHSQIKQVCDRYNTSYYPTFKKWADEYFFLKHRNETRGIGGIFFDRLSENDAETKQHLFNFVKETGSLFLPLYSLLANKNKMLDFSEAEKQWQYLRRGRYIEFNLVWDRGTKFGLDTDGRTESILMSLPPQARWAYDYKPLRGSKEEKTLNLLKKNIDWINFDNNV